jgi:hypothetical protein
MTRRDFSTWEVRASFKINTVLARALHKAMCSHTYDRFNAHTWALRVINAKPTTGAEMAAALVNFDWMIDSAVAKYETSPNERKIIDAALAAYLKWAEAPEAKAA